jgi:outer membrane cobalamin receptor
MFRGNCILKIILLFSFLTSLCAQELVVEGKVRDANTHRQISGVNVYIIEDTNFGTVTNAFGEFSLKVIEPDPEMVITFQHVAYDTLELNIEDVFMLKTMDLQERVIAVPAVPAAIAEGQLEISKDIPQTVSVIDAHSFDLRGYTDAGDLLKTDHSIQVDEELSGKKTVSIRGGTPDEVIVLNNGIRMNSSLDNVLDISLIDLADVERLEIIKGSHTTLYGPQAFSGIINVVPRAQRDYNIRVQQTVGTYATNDRGLNLYKRTGTLQGSYSFQKGDSEREIFDEPDGGKYPLKNESEHHNASLRYNFSETASGIAQTALELTYLRSDLNFENQRDSETISNFNQMLTGRFAGDLWRITDLSMSGAYQWLDEGQVLKFYNPPADSGFLNRSIENRAWYFNIDKSFESKIFNLLLGYQFENSKLNFRDDRVLFTKQPLAFEGAALQRNHHGFISIVKLKTPSESDFVRGINFDVSLRYDMVEDKQTAAAQPVYTDALRVRDPNDAVLGNSWEDGMVKFSTHMSGSNGKFAFRSFVNVGTNIKFPSLLQQISTRELLSSRSTQANLEPEKNHSMEVGVELSREIRKGSELFGWQLNGNFFRNAYTNKFRSYILPGTPFAVYDNVKNASITGYEAEAALFLFNKKMTMEFGASRYVFSDRAAFPFKHDRKLTLNVNIDQAGYSLQLHVFREGEQIAQLRNPDGGFSEVVLPAFSNMDIHFGKAFELSRVKLILNVSLRNMLDDNFDLGGFTLRDRRYYLTLGVQY